ncbi:MAG: HD domain-containing protein, partial [Candidatus Helarchaeota archaeon]
MEWNQFEKGIKKIIGELEVIKPRKPKPLIIQDAIYGPIKLDKMAVSLLENPLMQRLRLIKQLGCANFVFPSANHNRFEHSIGVYFVTCRIIEQLEKEIVKFKLEINGDTFDTLKNTMKAAAILHDIGQPPFSHVLEPFLEIAFIKRIEEGKIEPAAPHELLSKII